MTSDAPRGDPPPLPLWLRDSWARAASVHAVEVEGAVVRYRGWGLDARERPGLIFVHGFLAHARWWDHIAPHFTDRYRVAALDFTGMGDSDRRPAYSRRQYGREILAVARAAGMARPTLVAHSFGSVSTLYACAIAPDAVERVIIIDAFVYRSEDDGPHIPVQPERFYATRADALARYRLVPPGAWPDPHILAYLAEHSLRETPRGWSWKFDPETYRTHEERVRDEIRNPAVPVDFIHAGASEVVDAEALALFRAAVPNCGVPVDVPLSHHHIMIEQPLALIAALNGLLAHPRRQC
jgi:pimeloyl-ACP methyl ester carboxylesterase